MAKKKNRKSYDVETESLNTTPVEEVEGMDTSVTFDEESVATPEPEVADIQDVDGIRPDENAVVVEEGEKLAIETPAGDKVEVSVDPEPVKENIHAKPKVVEKPQPKPPVSVVKKSPERKNPEGVNEKWRLIIARNPSPLRLATVTKRLANMDDFELITIQSGNDTILVSPIYHSKEEAVRIRKIITKAGIATVLRSSKQGID